MFSAYHINIWSCVAFNSCSFHSQKSLISEAKLLLSSPHCIRARLFRYIFLKVITKYRRRRRQLLRAQGTPRDNETVYPVWRAIVGNICSTRTIYGLRHMSRWGTSQQLWSGNSAGCLQNMRLKWTWTGLWGRRKTTWRACRGVTTD